MDKDNVSGTLLALVAGATVGAGVGLLFASHTGSQVRSSLREHTRKALDQVDQAPDEGTGAAKREGVRLPGAEYSTRSGPHNHIEGDTGHDN